MEMLGTLKDLYKAFEKGNRGLEGVLWKFIKIEGSKLLTGHYCSID